jgi:hypothetical protein
MSKFLFVLQNIASIQKNSENFRIIQNNLDKFRRIQKDCFNLEVFRTKKILSQILFASVAAPQQQAARSHQAIFEEEQARLRRGEYSRQKLQTALTMCLLRCLQSTWQVVTKVLAS